MNKLFSIRNINSISTISTYCGEMAIPCNVAHIIACGYPTATTFSECKAAVLKQYRSAVSSAKKEFAKRFHI